MLWLVWNHTNNVHMKMCIWVFVKGHCSMFRSNSHCPVSVCGTILDIKQQQKIFNIRFLDFLSNFFSQSNSFWLKKKLSHFLVTSRDKYWKSKLEMSEARNRIFLLRLVIKKESTFTHVENSPPDSWRHLSPLLQPWTISIFVFVAQAPATGNQSRCDHHALYEGLDATAVHDESLVITLKISFF